ncbi:PAS domain S-box protein [Oscillatoria sp. CS-180]|uniref:PAS domain S-box protein n=1 Tax=Oscillatoria sp. CS-180 TaxID=3021720 RepID=UPI00232D4D20|nr:PAS domain S-box protein [Oscillatoria sp. CS-180]MDB9528271.1 PAS domain S-box protein [Oscillatoria sp. CS-180]
MPINFEHLAFVSGVLVMISDRVLYEQSPALLQTIDAEGRIVAVSDRWLAQLGYSRKAVIGHPWHIFLTKGCRAQLTDYSIGYWQTGLTPSVLEFQTQQGMVFTAEFSATTIQDERGQPYGLATLTNLAERSQLQDAFLHSVEAAHPSSLRTSQQLLLQLVFDNMPQRVFWKDLKGRFLGCNPPFAKDMGYTDPADIIGKTDHELLAQYPESVRAFRHQDQAVIAADQSVSYEGQSQHHHDGNLRWLSANKLPLKNTKGDIIGIFGSYEDITDRVSTRQVLQRYARMIEAATDGICLVDRNYRYQIINKTYRDWYGYTGQPILGQTIAEVLGQDDFRNRLQPLIDRSLNGEIIRYEQWFEFPHLGKRFRSITQTPYREASGEITGIVTSIRDLTALKESETRQQELLKIIESTPDFIGTASPEGEIHYVNPAFVNLMPSKLKVPQQTPRIQELSPVWAFEKIADEAIPLAQKQGTWQGETALLGSNGVEIPVFQTIIVHRDEQGDIKFYSTIAHDIRPQKALEHELRKRLQCEQLLSRLSAKLVNLKPDELVNGIHQALREVAEAIGAEHGCIYLLSNNHRSQTVFSQWHTVSFTPHLSHDESWTTVNLSTEFVAALDQRQVITLEDSADLSPAAMSNPLVADVKNGRSVAWVPMHHSQQLIGYIEFCGPHPKSWSAHEISLLKLIGDLFANVYQRHQAEDALRQQEHYFRLLTEYASDIVMLLDENGQLQYITPAVNQVLGYSPEELENTSLFQLIAIEDIEQVSQTLHVAAAQPSVRQPIVQYQIRHQNQQWRYFEATVTSLLHDPVVKGTVMNCRDVSDRITAEIAQHRSEQTFQAIFEQSAVSMAQISLSGAYLRVNPAFCQLVGHEADELIGEHYAKVTHPEDIADDVALGSPLTADRTLPDRGHKRFIRSDGSTRYVQMVVTVVQGAENYPAFFAVVYNDVTEQVLAQNSLRSLVEGTASVVGEDFFPVLARHLAESLAVKHILISQVTPKNELLPIVFWSHGQIQSFLSSCLSDSPGKRALREGFYCCPQKLRETFPNNQDLVALNAESYLGIALLSSDGQVIGEICVIHDQPIQNLDNATTLLRIFAARASAELERQRSNQALQDREAKWRNILNNMPVMLNAIDDDGFVTLWNKECERVTGYSADDIIGNPDALSLLYPDPEYRQRLQSVLKGKNSNYRNVEWATTCQDNRQRIIAWSNLSGLFPIPNLGSWGIGVDVTERQLAEDALRKSEARFRRLASNMPGIIYRYHRESSGRTYFSYLSAACREILEVDPEAGIQNHKLIWNLIHPDDQRRMLSALRTSQSRLTPISEDCRIVTPSGAVKWLKTLARPVREPNGSYLWDGVVIEITEQKETQQALQKSEALNRAILKALPDLILRMTQDGICLAAQYPETFPVLKPDNKSIGQNIRDTLPIDLAEQRLLSTQRALIMQETQISEYEVHQDGITRWEETRIVPLNETEVLVIVRDIDERRRAENEVRRLNTVLELQNQQLEALVELRTAELMTFMDSLPDLIYVVDRATHTMRFGNDKAVQLSSESTRQNYQGKTLFECFPSDRATAYDAQNQEVFKTGQVLHIEDTIETHSETIHLDTYKIPLKNRDGEAYALINSSRDVTELIKARQVLEAQAKQLAIVNHELQSFSYSVSHDLRAPLRHINGFIAALKRQLAGSTALSDPKVVHYLEVIESSSHKMGRLIDGLLVLSRVGRRELTLQPVALDPLVNHAIALLEDSPENNPDRLQITVAPLPTVHGDVALLQQVFTNLISNAVKFSRDRTPAKIHIGQRSTDHAFFVRDNGVGFDMTYADQLFSPFQRLHRQDAFQGTGIGLAIVSRIIHRHEGSIWAESSVNQGATFFFTLPQVEG